MKEHLKKKMLLFMVCILAFGAAFTGTASPVWAGTFTSAKAKKAIGAYQKFLGQKRIKWSDKSYDSREFQFMLADINSDKVPELFVKCVGNVSHYEGYEAVYYFCNNKVRLLRKSDAVTAFYPKKGVVEIRYYGMGGDISYYQFSPKGKVKFLGSIAGKDDPFQKTYYTWGKKQVKKSRFQSMLKKSAGKKKVKVKVSGWIDNVAANRATMSANVDVYR